MTPDMLLRAAVLAVLGAVSVSVWTLRVALTAEGRKVAAALLAGMDAVVFTLVFASVLSSLEAPLEVAGYGIGVACGTLLGLLADGRLSAGQSAVRLIVDGDGDELARALRTLGWPVTRLHGEGLTGAAAVLLVVVDDGRVADLTADLGRLAPGGFWTVERLRTAHPSPLPTGYRQVRTHAARPVRRQLPSLPGPQHVRRARGHRRAAEVPGRGPARGRALAPSGSSGPTGCP